MSLDLRNLLSIPELYTWFQRLVRGRCDEIYVLRHVRPKEGDRILDMGCGTGDLLRHMPRVEYLGMDFDQRSIDSALKHYGHRGVFVCGDLAEADAEVSGSFDIALATGVLHHLDDDQVARVLLLARRFLKPQGRLVTLDGCFTDGQSFLSRLILSMDRGAYVRKKEDYLRLAGSVFQQVESVVYHDLLRIPSAILVMECRS